MPQSLSFDGSRRRYCSTCQHYCSSHSNPAGRTSGIFGTGHPTRDFPFWCHRKKGGSGFTSLSFGRTGWTQADSAGSPKAARCMPWIAIRSTRSLTFSLGTRSARCTRMLTNPWNMKSHIPEFVPAAQISLCTGRSRWSLLCLRSSRLTAMDMERQESNSVPGTESDSRGCDPRRSSRRRRASARRGCSRRSKGRSDLYSCAPWLWVRERGTTSKLHAARLAAVFSIASLASLWAFRLAVAFVLNPGFKIGVIDVVGRIYQNLNLRSSYLNRFTRYFSHLGWKSDRDRVAKFAPNQNHRDEHRNYLSARCCQVSNHGELCLPSAGNG